MVKALENTVVALHSTRGGFIVTGCLAWSLWRSALMLSNVAASFAGHFLGGKGVLGLEKGLKRVELTVVGKASGVSSSDGRGSDGMAGIGDGGSVVSSSVSRGSDGVSGVGNGGSVVGSNGGSDGSNGKGLLVDVGLSGDLDIDVGLSGDLNVHVGLSGVLLVDVGLGRDLDIDVGLSGDLLVDVGLSGDLDVNVGLGGRVEVGVGNGRIVGSSIDSSVSNSRGSSNDGAGSVADSTGVASSSSVAVASGSSVAVASISSRVSVSTGRQNDSSVGHGQTGKGGNEGLHCDCEYCYCCRNRLRQGERIHR